MASLGPRTMPSFDSPRLSSKEAPVCVQKAMAMKERKPFTYTPGGLDLSEIKSEKMAKRLMRNALNPGLPEKPKPPTIVLNGSSMKPPVNYYNLPVAVFPSIQIPHNAKELLRKTNGPNRRDSFENEINSPKIQEKNDTQFEQKCEAEYKKDNDNDKKSTETIGEHKENIPIQETEIQIKKTTKTKKIKEKTGTKLKRKVSKTEKSSEKSTINIKEQKQEEQTTSRVDIQTFNACTNEQKEECKESEINIKNTSENVSTIVIKNESCSIETQKEVHTENEEKIFITNTSRATFKDKADISANESNSKFNKTEDICVHKEIDSNISNINKSCSIETEKEVHTENEDKILITNTSRTTFKDKVDQSSNISNAKSNKAEEICVHKEIDSKIIITKNDPTNMSNNTCFVDKKKDLNMEVSAELFDKNGSPDVEKENENLNTEQQQDDGDITPKINVITKTFESPIITDTLNSSKVNDKCDTTFTLSLLNGKNPKVDDDDKTIIADMKNCSKSFKRENSHQIVSRRKADNIKSLNNDLDNLPSLNLCSKRFSFLSESPSDEDPFSILTGIPAKISLANCDKKEPAYDGILNLNSTYKCDENIPKFKTNKIMIETRPIYGDSCNSANSSSSKISSDSCSKASVTSDGQNYISTWSSPKLFNDFAFQEDENVPAWKRELLEIANKKKEMKDESADYKEEIEPPWRKELRELAQSRLQKQSAPTYNVWNKLVKAVESPTRDEPLVILNPVWSQTLKPKAWKERKADLTKEKEVDIPEWKTAATLRRNFMNSIINKSTSSSSSCSSPGREIGKPPEVMIEITGHPLPSQEQKQPVNGYTNPWESSSESSTTFSPEPYTYERTPTPQSRNSPYAQSGMHSPVIAREFGSVNYQSNKRLQRRSCPIQSKSFKYLQMLTGTSDGLEDDEPFIAQMPQHSHLKPENV